MGMDVESLTDRQQGQVGQGLLLTLQRFPIHHPLDGGLGVPTGSTHQSPVLPGSQDEVLGFVQPVGGSWKARMAQAGESGGMGQAQQASRAPSRKAGAPGCQPQALTTCPGLIPKG